jgi:hypothetical protein
MPDGGCRKRSPFGRFSGMLSQPEARLIAAPENCRPATLLVAYQL